MIRHCFKLVCAAFLVSLSTCLLAQAGEQRSAEWAGSQSCQECHEDRHASWDRTWHSSMTQIASAATVAGRFDGQPVTYWGFTIRPVKRSGQFWFDYYRPGETQPFAQYRIYRTVGSHRYQQYLTQVDGTADNYYRLHLLWHIHDQRWVHMNGAFLSPDEQGFDDNVALWNHNCIFCHNTGPEPNIQNYAELQAIANRGEALDLDRQSLYQSSVSELGIACESCHGPAAKHVEVNRNPIKRTWNWLKGSDSTIVQPDKLNQQRSVQVCGQCHGQRTPEDADTARQWVHGGPVYRAGDNLFDSVDLVWPDTRIPGDADADRYRLRFWPDATPRLSAYEYQGLKQSACYLQSDELTCNTCHSMHGGDPDGMTTEWQRGNGPCLECHENLTAGNDQHTRHAPESIGSQCTNCHMPNIAYGVMTIHRSHRIEVPDPQLHASQQRPNACNQCHLDKSVEWATQQTTALWPTAGQVDKPAQAMQADPVAAGLYDLYAGDPVQRAIAAWSLQQAFANNLQPPAPWIPHLLRVMRDDNYPAVRRFAANAARAGASQLNLDELEAALDTFDFIAAPAIRAQSMQHIVHSWEQHNKALSLTPPQPDPAGLTLQTIKELQQLGRQRSVGISVGE